jgi:hypothetical protein
MTHLATHDTFAEARRYAVLFALCLLSFALKSPDALSTPQLWAEDGAIFFQQQQGRSLPLVFTPYAGYLHALPRLVAWVASWSIPQWSPLIYNVAAWLVNAACVAFVLQRIKDSRLQAIVFFGVFLVPTNGEVFGSITNTQWFVQFFLVAACFLPMRVPSRAGAAMMFGSTLLAGLTGPFSILIAITHLALWALGRVFPTQLDTIAPSLSGVHRSQLVALYLAALVQAGYLVSADNSGTTYSFATMVLSLGHWTQGHLFGHQIMPKKVFLLGLMVLGWMALRERTSGCHKGFILALGAVAALEILLASGKQDVVGFDLGYGDRYFVAFKVAFWLAVATCVLDWETRRDVGFVCVVGVLMLASLLNVERLARAPLEQKRWRETLDAAPPGQPIVVPINPTPWAITVQPRE